MGKGSGFASLILQALLTAMFFQFVVDVLWHKRVLPNLLHQRNCNGQCLFREEVVGGFVEEETVTR